MRLPLFVAFLPLAVSACTRPASPARSSAAATCIDTRKIRPDAVCPMQYDPVCGCDGKAYSNACVAENAGVTSYTKGDCPAKVH